MKNKIFKFFIAILLILPIIIKADNVAYESAITKTNNYMRLSSFSDRKKYINQDTKEYGFENGQIKTSSRFTKGGMLNKDEYLLTQVNGMSYLTLGLKYWTMTSNGGNQYYIENYLDSMEKTNTAGVRPTIYALPEVYVVGKGTYNIPWEFRAYHTVRITPKAYGTVACKSGDTTCSKSNTTVTKAKIETGENANFIITPNSGYKYLANDTCNLKHVSGNEYQIKNIVNDIRCIVEFYPRTYTLNLEPGEGVTYRTQPSPTKLYLKWTVGMFSDSNATNKVSSITPPTRTGYQFKGYYYGTTKVINEDGTIVSEQSKTITGFNSSGSDAQALVAQWEANKMHITYDKNGATEYNDPPNSLNVTLLYDGTDYSRKEGLPNYACKKDDCWYAFSKAGYHGTLYWLVGSNTSNIRISVETAFAKNQDMFTGNELTNFQNNKDTYVTLYAEWIQCKPGTYKKEGTGGDFCSSCPAGSFQPNSGATGCTECAVGSITTSEGQPSCTPCQPSGATGANGTTTDVGQSSCNKSCSKSNVATWETQIWTNNETNPKCTIRTCATGYHLNGNNCVPNELKIIYNANGGSDLRGDNAIPKEEVLKYNGITYSGKDGLPNYACTGDCYWRLAKAGHHGTSNWLVNNQTATSTTKKINANTAYATNQALANDMGVLNSFQNNAYTEVNLYAEWVECNAGTYISNSMSGTTCTNCPAGQFAAGKGNASCTNCAIGSITASAGQSSCTPCQPSGANGANGTTTAVGQTSCNKACGTTHVATWETQVWTNNETAPICKIKTCATGYHSANDNCVANEYNITYEYNGGTAPSSGVPATYKYGVGATINGVPTKSGNTFLGWSSSSDLSNAKSSITISTTDSGNKKYYAKWEASNPFTFAYNGKFRVIDGSTTTDYPENTSGTTYVTISNNNWRVFLYTNGTLHINSISSQMDIFAVGGGGGGAGTLRIIEDGSRKWRGGCGGGGGQVVSTTVTAETGNHAVVIGSGGAGGAGASNVNNDLTKVNGSNGTATTIVIGGQTVSAAGGTGGQHTSPCAGGTYSTKSATAGGNGANGTYPFGDSSFGTQYGAGGGGGQYINCGSNNGIWCGGSLVGQGGTTGGGTAGNGAAGNAGTDNTGSGGGAGGPANKYGDSDSIRPRNPGGKGGTGIIILKNH